MKKSLLYILSAMLLLVSCTNELHETYSGDDSDGKVTVSFNVALPGVGPMTKALGEEPAIKNLYVAVFDEGGYLVEYVPATFLTASADTYVEATPAEGVYSPNSDGVYTFQVTLTTTDEFRSLHFIANSPVSTMEWGSEVQRISTLFSENDSDAYWQNIVLASGIVDNVSEMKTRLGGTVVLVRNFAKVSISSSSSDTFDFLSAKIYNVPDKGSIAIYNPENGFISGYQSKNFEWVSSTANYGGYMPSSAELLNSFVDSDLIAAQDGVVTEYIYERPAPTSNPCFAIVKGRYRNDASESWSTDPVYYKVNLRSDNGDYYPFLRNYSYKILVKTVGLQGHPTLDDALQSAGDGGDVSTNIEFADLTEISGQNSRLIVSETTIDVVGSQKVEVWYKYQPSLSSSTISNGDVAVTKSDEDVYGAAIGSYEVAGSDSADGSRKITIYTTDSDPTYIKTQTLTLVGTNGSGEKIQRVITINVRPVMTLKVSCTKKVPETTGSPLQVKIGIPAGLPQSLFPLPFKIEAAELSIMPAGGENLPVENGKSMADASKPTFFYVKTLDWDEYAAATADSEGYKYFISNFKTNTDKSASDIYVGNQYFNTASCNFTNAAVNSYTVTFDPIYVGTNANTSNMRITTMDNTPFSITLTGATAAQTSFTPSNPAGETIVVPITYDPYGIGIGYTITAAEGDEYEVYSPCNGTEYRTLNIPAGVLTAEFTSDPCNGSYTNNKGTATVNVGFNSTNSIGTVKFNVTRNGNTITIPTPTGKVTRTSYENNQGRTRYDFSVELSNYDRNCKYYYSTGTGTTDQKTEVTVNNKIFTVSGQRNNTIYIWAQKQGQYSYYSTVTTSVTRSNNSDKQITTYGYSGTNQVTSVKLDRNVETTTPLYFFINSKSDSQEIDDIITGTVDEELQLQL